MKKNKKILAGILVGLLCSWNVAGVAFAEGVGLISQCTVTLPPLYTNELNNFLSFLDQTFKNKSSNTSLTNIAIQRYAEYKRAIKAIFAQLGPQAYALVVNDANKNITSVSEIEAYKSCQTITEQYIEKGKQQMMERIKTSATQKSATIMLEKYKAINMKLRDLNLQIAKMYAMFMSFANKLPGFLGKCESK